MIYSTELLVLLSIFYAKCNNIFPIWFKLNKFSRLDSVNDIHFKINIFIHFMQIQRNYNFYKKSSYAQQN